MCSRMSMSYVFKNLCLKKNIAQEESIQAMEEDGDKEQVNAVCDGAVLVHSVLTLG